MNNLSRFWLIPLLFLLALSGASALAQHDDGEWAPTPPRLSFVDGEVSTWRPGAEEWARARPNLALAAGDALYTGKHANLEVQFGSRSFVRADEDTQLSPLAQEEHRIQFKLTGGRASFDLRSLAVGDMQSPRARTESAPPPPGTPRNQRSVREREVVRSPPTAREQGTERPEARPAQPAVVAPPASQPSASGSEQAPRLGSEAAPPRGESRQDEGKSKGRGKEEELPGQPANQTYRGRDRDSRDAR